jgi:MFS family permease
MDNAMRRDIPSSGPRYLRGMPAPAPRSGNDRYAWYVVAILTLANISGFVDRQVLNLLVKPIEQDFGITDTQMSYLQGWGFALFYTLLGFPIARWADRSSRRNIIGAGVGVWSVFTALCASAASFGRLLLMRIGVGVGEATLQAPSVSLLADYFPRERLSRAMSVYSLGIFFGSGLGYLIGAWVASVVGIGTRWHLPLLGDIRPWQSAFLIVGLPGLLIAILVFTIAEPARRNVDQAGRYLPLGVFFRWVRENFVTYFTHGVGFATSAAVNFALAAWIPTFFLRTYGWSEPRAGRVMGILTMTVGVLGVLTGGWVADSFVKRGRVDGPLRLGIVGAFGMLVSATAFPLMPNAYAAVAALTVVNFFAAFPWGPAAAGAAEIAPTPLRAQGAALYWFLLSLISGTLGPTSVALFTDHLFGRDGVRYSIASVNAIGMTIVILLFAAGLGSYRRTIARRDDWSPDEHAQHGDHASHAAIEPPM